MTIAKRQGIKIFSAIALLCFISITSSALFAQGEPCDRFESFNRGMFAFNEKVDVWFLRPIATLYNKIIPKPLNIGIHNFFNNINTVPTIWNDVLQLHFYQMANDSWRLLINSTIGIGGLFDPATSMGLKPYSNDFGLTLAHYGWKESMYVVLPFMGPNTLRDVIEIPVDYYYFSVYPGIHPQSLRYQLYGLGVIDRRVQLLRVQNLFEEAAIDRYVFVRDAYLQRRAYQIEQNKHRTAKELWEAKLQKVDAPILEELKPDPVAPPKAPILHETP